MNQKFTVSTSTQSRSPSHSSPICPTLLLTLLLKLRQPSIGYVTANKIYSQVRIEYELHWTWCTKSESQSNITLRHCICIYLCQTFSSRFTATVRRGHQSSCYSRWCVYVFRSVGLYCIIHEEAGRRTHKQSSTFSYAVFYTDRTVKSYLWGPWRRIVTSLAKLEGHPQDSYPVW